MDTSNTMITVTGDELHDGSSEESIECIICLGENRENMVIFPTTYSKCLCKYNIHLQCLQKLTKPLCIMNCGSNMGFKKKLSQVTIEDVNEDVSVSILTRRIGPQPSLQPSVSLYLEQQRDEINNCGRSCCCTCTLTLVGICICGLILWGLLELTSAY
jgi:hypothetical protein